MTKLAVIRAVVAAFFVGAAALVTGYFYSDGDLAILNGSKDAPQEVAQPEPAEAAPEPAADEPATDIAQAEESTGEAGGETGFGFDVVGVEPTGDTVVAGRAEPGSIVALTANGEVVGKTVADNRGEWTIILDDPLPAGDYDVGLETQAEDGTPTGESEQRLTISIPEDGKNEPLVVLNTPDAPSTLLQKPEGGIAAIVGEEGTGAPDPQLAAAGSAGEGAEGGAETPEQLAGSAVEQPQTTVAARSEQGAGSTEAEDGSADPATRTDVAQGSTSDTPLAPEVDAEAGSETLAQGQTGQEQTGQGQAELEQNTESQIAAVSPAEAIERPAADAAAAPQVQNDGLVDEAPASQSEPVADTGIQDGADEPVVTVEAVESERGTVYVAGQGDGGTRVQVYVDGALLGSKSLGENGRWLIEGEMALEAGSVDVRADMTDTGGDVVARAAVTFEKEDEAIILTRVAVSGEGAGPTQALSANVAKPLPNVIIRKGDNLWRISRRLYGSGFRYTTIYQANKSQIRDPDLIYPGQVFLTPEGDLNWQDTTN